MKNIDIIDSLEVIKAKIHFFITTFDAISAVDEPLDSKDFLAISVYLSEIEDEIKKIEEEIEKTNQ